jgi:DNA modification methylase
MHGDVIEVLEDLVQKPEYQKRFRAIITSPPYYGHRSYGSDPKEIGREKKVEVYLDKLTHVFKLASDLLTDDGTLWIVIGDTRRQGIKLDVPHKLTDLLTQGKYLLRDEIIWYKRNHVSGSSRSGFTPAYESVLFFSKNKKYFANLDAIRTKGNEAIAGKNKVPPADKIQTRAMRPDKAKILKLRSLISKATRETPFKELPSTSEIASAYGFEPEKHCPTCYRKWKRHATRKRIGGHSHYPIFARCNPKGKNPSNVWVISTKAHYGNEHFAIFPEELVQRIIDFATVPGDHVLDVFAGRGTTGIVCAKTGRFFTGIDLYSDFIETTKRNLEQAKNTVKIVSVAAKGQ